MIRSQTIDDAHTLPDDVVLSVRNVSKKSCPSRAGLRGRNLLARRSLGEDGRRRTCLGEVRGRSRMTYGMTDLVCSLLGLAALVPIGANTVTYAKVRRSLDKLGMTRLCTVIPSEVEESPDSKNTLITFKC